MKLTRFCSLAEFGKYMAGETLTNTTDHYQGGKGGSVSTGFCFSPDEPKTAWRYLKGIVNPEACMLLEISEELLTPSFGKYADYSKGHSGEISCIKTEYCLTEYSQKTARLIKFLTPEEFASSPEEVVAAKLYYIIKTLTK